MAVSTSEFCDEPSINVEAIAASIIPGSARQVPPAKVLGILPVVNRLGLAVKSGAGVE